MNLLFLEPDRAFYDWLSDALKDHTCTRAADIEQAEDIMSRRTFDACFVDVSPHGPMSVIIIARARMICQKCPLIMLNGQEARADLVKICDGFIFKGALTNPETEIPKAVEWVTKRQDASHPMDLTAKLFEVVTSLRIAAP